MQAGRFRPATCAECRCATVVRGAVPQGATPQRAMLGTLRGPRAVAWLNDGAWRGDRPVPLLDQMLRAFGDADREFRACGGRRVRQRPSPEVGAGGDRGMCSGRRERFIQQDKGMPQQSRNSLSSRGKPCGTRLRQCRRVARQLWPIVVALISLTSAAFGLRLGVGSDVSRSAPTARYRTPQFVERSWPPVCPLSIAAFGRAQGDLGPGGCPAARRPSPRASVRSLVMLASSTSTL
jgi:hypothetical protein